MSLATRQRDRAVELALQEELKRGVPPTQAIVAERVLELLPTLLGAPHMDLLLQAKRGHFRPDWQNTMFAKAAIDLELLYAEDIDIIERIMTQLALAEISGRRIAQSIKSLHGLVEDLLLTSQRGTNFFHSVYDNFADLSKIDQTRSDLGVDVLNGIVSLPPEDNTRRIPMGHLLDMVTAPAASIEPAGAILRTIEPFRNAFADLTNSWQVQALTVTDGEFAMAVNIPLVRLLPDPETGIRQGPVEMTRIILHPISPTPFTVLPLWATEGTGFQKFAEVSSPINVDGDSVVIDLPPTRATAIQLQLRKTAADGEDQITLHALRGSVGADLAGDSGLPKSGIPSLGDLSGIVSSGRTALRRLIEGDERQDGSTLVRLFSYVFGFRQISVWRTGHRRTGVLVSELLTPQDATDLPTIDKVSLSVDEKLPVGATIRYEVASNATPETFVPISPMNRPDSGVPKVVDFSKVQKSSRRDNVFTIDSTNPPTSLGTIRGTEFFSLREVADPNIFKTAKLWRGANAWHCQRSKVNQNRAVRSQFIDFTNNDTQRLYT
ncbi:MAG TPA: hypothetical protein VM537_21810, partial [Anaerolineae bacterium]|nr:hypothetical protein [Anaerolineae bacterium]